MGTHVQIQSTYVKGQALWCVPAILTSGEAEAGGFLGFLANQSSLISVSFRFRERYCLSEQMEEMRKE